MKKVYIAGKVTGVNPVKASQKFAAAENWLVNQGYTVYNPMKLVLPGTQWEDAMKICIRALTECDIIYTLPCWRRSQGARLEVKIAKKLKMRHIKQLL